MSIPDFESNGDLPLGLHRATLDEVLTRFGKGTTQRKAITKTLAAIYTIASATGHLERFIVYGSYVTDKLIPNDVDIFLVMREDFKAATVSEDARLIFSHGEAQNKLGASIFWVTQSNSFATIDYLIMGWQTKRDKMLRGIIEIVL